MVRRGAPERKGAGPRPVGIEAYPFDAPTPKHIGRRVCEGNKARIWACPKNGLARDGVLGGKNAGCREEG